MMGVRGVIRALLTCFLIALPCWKAFEIAYIIHHTSDRLAMLEGL
jgi:hypothetical protein